MPKSMTVNVTVVLELEVSDEFMGNPLDPIDYDFTSDNPRIRVVSSEAVHWVDNETTEHRLSEFKK